MQNMPAVSTLSPQRRTHEQGSSMEIAATGSSFVPIYSTATTDAILQSLVRHYGLRGNVECRFVSRGVSDTYQLITTAGDFAFKLDRCHWRTRDAILSEVSVLQQLDAKGIRVATPVARTNGKMISDLQAPEGLRSGVLFNWIPGRAPKYDDSRSALEYGRAVARLHSAGDDILASVSRPWMDLECVLERPLARIQPRLRSIPAVAESLEQLVDRLRTQLSQADKQSWDWGFCHGDLWSNNARIYDDELFLFDFEFCGAGWRLYDLASYRWHARFEGKEQLAWEPFLDGYRQVRSVADDSLRYIQPFMILKHLWGTAHALGFATDFGDPYHSEDFLTSEIRFCESIEAGGLERY